MWRRNHRLDEQKTLKREAFLNIFGLDARFDLASHSKQARPVYGGVTLVVVNMTSILLSNNVCEYMLYRNGTQIYICMQVVELYYTYHYI